MSYSSLQRSPEENALSRPVRFLSVGRRPTFSTEPAVQLDLESGTTVVSDSPRGRF